MFLQPICILSTYCRNECYVFCVTKYIQMCLDTFLLPYAVCKGSTPQLSDAATEEQRECVE